MKIKFEVYPKPQKIKANKIITLLTNIDDEMLDHRIRWYLSIPLCRHTKIIDWMK